MEERGRFLNFARWFAAAPLRSRRIPPHDFDEPIGECGGLADRRVDPSGEGPIISVLRADDDAWVGGQRSVEPLEVFAMDGEHAAMSLGRKATHGVILDALLDRPTSCMVRTSCPKARRRSTTSSGKFSLA